AGPRPAARRGARPGVGRYEGAALVRRRGRAGGRRPRSAHGGRHPAAGLIVAATPRRYPLRLLLDGGRRRPRRTAPSDTGGGTVMSIGNGAVTGDRSARGGLRGAVVAVGAAPILLL